MRIFLSTLSLRRATHNSWSAGPAACISIHALLAESDAFPCDCIIHPSNDFYPRSPCGERPPRLSRVVPTPIFLSTLSLRRATNEALQKVQDIEFLSTLSLRRATTMATASKNRYLHFYPRSPCGERRKAQRQACLRYQFLSTLSLRRATVLCLFPCRLFLLFLSTLSLRRATFTGFGWLQIVYNFYPRSPCGERPSEKSTPEEAKRYFYPRSPCGERRVTVLGIQHKVGISIHALLAESDYDTSSLMQCQAKFLSTLSLRRATKHS